MSFAKLCEPCTRLSSYLRHCFEEDSNKYHYNNPQDGHQPDVKSLRLSSTHCELCKLISNGLAERHDFDGSSPISMYMSNLSTANKSRRLTIRVIQLPNWSNTFSVEIFATTGQGGVRDRPIWSNNRIAPIDRIILVAQQWIASCVSRHPYCSYHRAQSSASEQPPLPTRVIDVGSPGSSEEPRLLETKNKSGAYATLSHCWGASQPLVTTRDTFKERQQRLPLRDLPKTFQDAVLLARGLRIRYLWIDSLCIIQDDAEDWQREAAKMASVYYGAHINFAASSANGCYEGCLYECPPALHLGPNLFARHGFGPFRSNEKAFPLNGRGWILQESVLSRRTIHLGRNQVYWECCSYEECEDGCWTFDQDLHAEKPNYLTHPTKLLHYLRHTLSDSNFGKDLTRAKIYELWNNLMNQYCKRSLTYEKDRIPALAGINQLFQEILADRPIAGLWETELHIGLCWKSCRDLPTDPMPGVPSWSWLSQSWPAKPQLLNYYPVDIWLCGAKPKDFTGTLQIKSARVFWTGPMFTSRMAGGEIVALARIKEISVEHRSTCPPLGHISRHNFLDKSLSQLYIGECDLDLRPSPGKIWCLEIGTQSCEPQQRTITLAVQQLDNVPGVYRRIGIGHIRDHEWIAGEEWQEIHLV